MGLKLQAEVGLDGSGFERGLHRLGERGKEFSADFVKNAAISAFGIYGIEEAIHKTVETATELVNESKRLDVTVEQLQLLRQAAKDGGTEMGTLASAFEKLDIARAKALSGDKGSLSAFAKLGVDKNALQTQTAATLFTNQISGAVKGGNVENIAPVLREVLGRGFGELIPVLKTDFDELGDTMKKLGTIMDAETAVKLKSLGDEFELLSKIITAQLGPALIWTAETLYKAFAKISGFAAALGAGTANWSLKDWIAALAPGTGSIYAAAKYDTKASNAAYTDTTKPLMEALDKLKEKLQKEADDLKNPKPIVPPTDAAKVTPHAVRVQSDALVKVGNFLGSNGNTISRVDQRKINLMEQHLTELKGIKQAIGTSGGTFGYGIPVV